MESPAQGPIEALLAKVSGNAPRRIQHETFEGPSSEAQRQLNAWLARNQDARVINVETLKLYRSASIFSPKPAGMRWACGFGTNWALKVRTHHDLARHTENCTVYQSRYP